MKCLRKRSGFTLIELLVVILILAILMAIALPLYLRAVRDSERQTCRSNMQTIAVACQAYRVRDPAHYYPGATSSTGPEALVLDGTTIIGTGADADLPALPVCPKDTDGAASYTGTLNSDGSITIYCNCNDSTVDADSTFHNELGLPNAEGLQGFTPGLDAK